MADLNVYITTFNCGRNLINVDYFAASLFHGLKSDLPPDLIVLTLQEIAPLGYSFLGGSLLAPYFAHFTTAILDGATRHFGKDAVYNNVLSRNVGMTGIMLFAKQESSDTVRWTETAGVGAGLWEMGNKGAVGLRVGVGRVGDQETTLTFVAAHLAPMENQCERRNEDWKSICQGLVFSKETTTPKPLPHKDSSERTDESEPLLSQSTDSSTTSLFSPTSHIFFSGDLNYRTTDTSPTPEAHKSWPQSLSPASSFTPFLKSDQLTRERTANHTLHHLSETPITFSPTYKLSSLAQTHSLASSLSTKTKTLPDGRTTTLAILDPYFPASQDGPSAEGKDVSLWAKHRTPSWTDRILYLENSSLRPEAASYTALAIQPTSDHRPVAMSFSIKRGAVETGVEIPFAVREDWKEKREAARRWEILVGVAAYLGLTWEGEALLVGTLVGVLGGYLALRALLA